MLGVLAGAVALTAYVWFTRALVPTGERASAVEIVVPPGTPAIAIGGLLHDAGLDIDERPFALTARLLGVHNRLQSGVYELPPGASLEDILRKLSRGEAQQFAVTLIEGWRFSDMLRAVQKQPGIVVTLPTDPDEAAPILARQAGLPTAHPEGYIFPDTYLFTPGHRDIDLFLRAIRLQRKVLAQAWEARNARVVVNSPQEALVLASIIEKETQFAPDRQRVSAVFQNRLSIGMPLQSDPTVIYALGREFDGNLRRPDLRVVSPYNTYVVRGLPPTPISNPGRAALLAALNPSPTKALYFVARGDGSSYFSENLDTHNQAVNFYQRGRGPKPADLLGERP